MELDINKLTEKELELSKSLSRAVVNIDKYMVLLSIIYGFTLSKKELAKVLKVSTQTLDRRISEKIGIPGYIKSSTGTRASYLFPIYEVAVHLSNTIKVVN